MYFGEAIRRPDQLYEGFNQSMGGIFDEAPIVLPVPDESQLDALPVVQLQSSGAFYSNIARRRVDFFCRGLGRQKYSDVKSGFLKHAKDYFKYFNSQVAIKRLGFVIRFFVEESEPDKVMAKLLNNDFKKLHQKNAEIDSTYETAIHYVARNEIAGLNINNATILKKTTVDLSGGEENLYGILITRDFNTIPEDADANSKKYNEEVIGKFLNESEGLLKLDELKKILWPES